MPIPAITAFYAGVLGLIGLGLASQVVRGRLRHGIELGDAGHPEMQRAMRVFGNFIEYVPMILLLIAFGEMLGVPRWLTHLFGVALVIARLLHAVGLGTNSGRSLGRFTGTMITWLVLLAASVGLIWLALGRGLV